MSKPFKLSSTLYGHSLDVRSVAVTSDNSIVSGSRDKTAKFWKPNGINTSYTDVITYKDQKNFVGCVLYLDPSNEHPDGLVLTGGNDSVILVYKPAEPFATFTIKEHKNTVSCLAKGLQPNSFISGSWDTTAKYWNLNKSQTALVTFSGHIAAIWGVLQLEDSRFVTASADKTIGIWSPEGKKLSQLEGHTDCVRALCDMPDLGFFMSASNDATVRCWAYSGDCLNTYYGHTNYIYSIARCKAAGNNCFVSSDEDRTIRFWKDGINTETINIPAQSAWSVACLSNGDIVVGASDGLVRIFTQDENRFADEATMTKFDEEVQALISQNLQEIGGYKVSDLPGREALYDPGKRAGQMKMVRESGGVVAYTWVEDGDNSHWEKVGDVLGANNNKQNEGTMFEGKSYDFVFSVDVEDGKPPLKLPYNKNDDPYKAAQAFLGRNDLPQVYLDQVVDFILKNSNTQIPVNNTYVDPFTGGSRYTPGTTQNSQFQGANVDPFTGGSSYSSGLSNPRANMGASAGANADPFTGGMSYTTSGRNLSCTRFFPHTKYLSFEMGNPSVILNKLKEFNQKTGGSMEEKSLEELVTICNGPPNDLNIYDTLFKLLLWPEDLVFPVLDVVRMAVRHEKNNQMISTENSEILIPKLQYFISDKSQIENNIIVALRTLSNLFSHASGESLVYDNRFDIIENLTSMNNLNKNGQIALSTLILNMVISSVKKNDDLAAIVFSEVLQELLVSSLKDTEAQFRAYVALGTLLVSSSEKNCKEVKIKLKTNLSFMKTLGDHSSLGGSELETKRMNCAKDVADVINA